MLGVTTKGCKMASQTDGYWSRSWALLTRDKGWIKPVLVVAAASLVPIVGQFGANGYALEWGRLTAWGVDSAPKQKDVNVSGCIKSGARAFVVSLGIGLVFGLVNGVIRTVLGSVFGGLISLAVTIASAVLIMIASLRATIYQSIGAGYEIERIADMIKRDYKGLLRVGGLTALLTLGVGFMAGILMTIVLFANAGSLYEMLMLGDITAMNDREIAITVLRWLGSIMPTFFVLLYFFSIAGTITNLLTTTAVALWMRQFDVQHWGESSDPLPNTAPGGPSATTYGGVPAGQTPSGQYEQSQQPAGMGDASWQNPVAEVPQPYAPQASEEPQALPMVVPEVQQVQPQQPQQPAQPVVTPPPQTFDLMSAVEPEPQAVPAETYEEPSSEVPGLEDVLREIDAQRAAEDRRQSTTFTLDEASSAPAPAVEPAQPQPMVPTFSLFEAEAAPASPEPALEPMVEEIPVPYVERSDEQVVSVIDLTGPAPMPVREETPEDVLPMEPAFEPEVQQVDDEPQILPEPDGDEE